MIIPVHKSDLDIERCVNSLLAINELQLQIIVAANSDSEEQLEKIDRKVKDCYSDCPCVSIVNIHKGGKANAINKALNLVLNEIVLIGDADTFFCKAGLLECLSVIQRDQSVVAVSGNVDVYGRNGLSYIQQFEYRRIFRIFRPLWSRLNGNLMISGCAGIFRTKCLFEVGLYDTQTIGEDFEITLRLHDYYIRHRRKYSIRYLNILLAKTDAPLKLKALIKQRGRWFRGFLEVTGKYRRILEQPICYRSILLPFLWSVVFEKWPYYLKWVFISVSAGICIRNDEFILNGVFLYMLGFIIMQMVFNLFMMKRLLFSKNRCAKRVHCAVQFALMTVCLIGLQFLMKDTSVILSAFTNRTKENKW